MTRYCGVVRDEAGLRTLCGLIEEMAEAYPAALSVQAARLIAEWALARRESRGGHYRADYPQTEAGGQHTRARRAVAVAA